MVSYLIKSILCSGLLLVVYHFLLEREKMLRFNRFYLLAAMVFSLLVPLVTIEMPYQTVRQAIIDNPVSQSIVRTPAENASQIVPVQESTAPSAYLPWLVYGLVAASLLMRTGFQMLVIFRSKSGRQVVPFETAQLVLTPGDTPTYSFFKFIFIPQKAFESQSIPKEILTHELAHTRQMHSLDILFTELLIALWWFNPLLLLYRRAIRLNHEYLADDAVLAGATGVKEYQLLLLDTLLAHRTTALASSFNYPFTKKRLAMMTTNINLRIQFAKKALVALLLPVLAFVLAEKTYSQEPPTKTGASSEKRVEVEPATGKGAVSEAEMQDFFETIGKYTKYVKNKKGRIDKVITIDQDLENQLYAVYERMSETQQAQLRAKEIGMYKLDIPLKKSPTPEVFENWKRPDVFGVWLNGKHVPNSVLNKYQHSDIAEYYLSKLYGAAKKGRSYKYQLDLETNEYFDKHYDERVKNRVIIMRTVFVYKDNTSKKAKN